MSHTKLTAALLGLATGDALGVPVEFVSRTALQHAPVTTMQGYGTHSQPPGTWSDDSSLAFCLAESLCLGYDLTDLAQRCIDWRDKAYWTAHNTVFDIGIATSAAISRLRAGTLPTQAGGAGENDNGNGSLMRILPLVAYLTNKPMAERFASVTEVSALTHAHIRSVLGCFLYVEYALLLLKGTDKWQAYRTMQEAMTDFLINRPDVPAAEVALYRRVLTGDSLTTAPVSAIQSSGYVLHTLEASLWCFLTTDAYADAVLKAVNLGSDTDTTGCVTGGLAGLYYGADAIPADWLAQLARHDDIVDLGNRLTRSFPENQAAV